MSTMRITPTMRGILGMVVGVLLILATHADGMGRPPKTFYVPGEDFATIGEALSSEDVKDGDTIIVADGTYAETNLDFAGKALVLKSQNGPEKCIIDAGGYVEGQVRRGFIFNHGETGASVLSGFTITNGGAEYGGAIAIEGAASPTIMNCIISNSTAQSRGGAVSIDTSTPVIVNCLFVGNAVVGTAEGEGYGAAVSTYASNPIITNCTFVGNHAAAGGDALFVTKGSAPVVTNSILWDVSDVPDEIYVAAAAEGEEPSNPVVTYSDVQLVVTDPPSVYGDDPTNINADPMFEDTAAGNYRLSSASPCIGKGNATLPELPDTDLDGLARIVDGSIDMGPYEYNPYGTVTAAFNADPQTGNAPLLVTFADESVGNITSWEWDFGDGGEKFPAPSAEPFSHEYASPGVYTVTLTVTGPGGTDTLVKKDYIKVKKAVPAPVALFVADKIKGKAGLKVKFTNKSKNAYKYDWNFDDGTPHSKVQNPIHTFATAGEHTVTLTAYSKSGQKDEYSLTINVTPPDYKADFSGAPKSGKVPLTVKFTAKEHKDIATYEWTFGDGTPTVQGKSVKHTYNASGKYDVTLKVKGQDGGETELTKLGYIIVSPKGGKK